MTDPFGVIDLSSLAQPAGQDAGAGPAAAHEVRVEESNLEQVIAGSQQVATLLVVTSARVPGIGEFLAALRREVDARGGAVLLATVDADAQPRVAAALRVQQLPSLMLLIQGQIQPIVEALLPEEELPTLFDQLVQLAAQVGFDVSGAGELPEGAEAGAPAEPELPPLVQSAYDAIEAGDLDGAREAFTEHLSQNPADAEAKAGLATVRLMSRTQGADLIAVRAAAAEAPGDLEAQLAAADIDMLGGHVDDAFGRLLELLRGADPETKAAVRDRLLELFEIAGPDDARVGAARKRLANLLF